MATGRRRGRAIFYIAFILILIVVLVFVVARFPQITGNKGANTAANKAPAVVATPTPDKVLVVVTAQDVRRGQVLTDDLVAVVEMSREGYKPGAYYSKKELVLGSRAKMDIKAHIPLTSSLVYTPGSTSSAPSFEIPVGKVAISVPISKLSSVAYGLQKGDHVNVLVSLLMTDLDTNFQSKLPNRTGNVIAPGPMEEGQTYVTALLHSGSGWDVTGDAFSYLGRIEIDPTLNNPVYVIGSESPRPRMVSQTLLQDVMILQMGTFALTTTEQQAQVAEPAAQPGQPTPTRAAANRNQQAAATEVPKLPDVITLVVSPQDAVTLNYLMLAGANMNLVLRSAGDNEIRNTEAVTLQFIMDQYQIPNPAKLPYGMEPRMDAFPNTIGSFPALEATPAP